MRKKYCSSVGCWSLPSVFSVFQCLSRTVEKKRRKFPPSVREIQCVIQRWVLHAWYSETLDETLHQRSYTCIYFETSGLKGEVIFAEEWLCFAGMTMLLPVIVFCRNNCIYPWLCFTGSWSLRGSFSWTVTSVWWSLTQQPRAVRSSRLSRPRSAWGLTLSASASTRSWAAQVCSLAVPRVYTKGK